jgi:mannosyltransferase
LKRCLLAIPGKEADLQIIALDQLKHKARLILDWRSLTRTQQLLLAITAAGAIFRLFLLGAKSIWLDEAFSISITQRGFIDVLRMVVQTDTHPPLYYLVLKLWLLFSHNEAWARLLSAIFSIASIPLMYRLVSLMYRDERAGLLGAGILAFSPFHLWYAQETRMYAMLIFFILASACFFIRALQNGETNDWLGYIVTTALALYTDNGAIWYLVTLAIFFLLSVRRFRQRFVDWFLSNLVIALLYAVWLPFLYMQVRQVTTSFWLPPPSFQTVLDAILDFSSYNFPVIEISLLFLAIIFVFAYIVPGKSWQRQLANLWLFLPLAISLLLSLRQPIFLSRNLISASLGLYLLIIDTIWKFQARKAILALFIPLMLMNLVSIGRNLFFIQKEDWRDAAKTVAISAESRPGGLVVFIPGFSEIPFQYYYGKNNRQMDTQGYPGDELLLHPDPVEVAAVDGLLSGRPYVWLVVRQGESLDPNWEKIKIWLDTHGYVRYPGFERGSLAVLFYTRWDKVPPTRNPTGFKSRYGIYFPAMFWMKTTRIYIVQPGDTLLEVAIRFHTTVEALAEVNDFENPNKLTPGQTLIIP